MNLVRYLNSLLSENTTKAIFDHIKNFLVCGFLLAIGLNEFRQHSSLFFNLIPSQGSGAGVIILSVVLFFINLNDGVRKISSSKHHIILIMLLVLLYVFLSVRIVEMAWQFRVF